MKNQHISLAIILKKTQNGYLFEALEEQQSSTDKNKKPKVGKKPVQKGVPNRLIKEIGLSNEHLMAAQIAPPPEPQPLAPFDEEQHDNYPVFQPVIEEEEISCEIDRETDLPKTPAIWFNLEKISNIEQSEMKEFFVGSETKTPSLYLKYRNFIVESYLKNPRRYLSKIACRRILRGDVNTIMRIHEFLEKHGIINFSINYDGSHTFKGNCLSKHHEQRVKPQTFLKSLPQQDQETAQKQIDTDNMTITVINKNFSRTYRACCYECKLICGIVWFANVSDEESNQQKNLCFECWSAKSEQEKSQYAKVDIVKKMQAHNRDSKSFPKNAWNIEENIKLLDFMSNSEKSWKKLLDQFGGKRTIQDIVLQFLQFPISNVDINDSRNKNKVNKEKLETQEAIGFGPEDYNRLLKDFYANGMQITGGGIGKKRGKKSAENGKKGVMKEEEGVELPSTLQNTASQEIKEILSLTMEQIQAKLQGLKERQEFVHQQGNSFDCLNAYRSKQHLLKLGEQEEGKGVKSAQQEKEKKSESLPNGNSEQENGLN